MSEGLWLFSLEKPESEVGKKRAGWLKEHCFHAHLYSWDIFVVYKKNQTPSLAKNCHSRLIFVSVVYLAQK